MKVKNKYSNSDTLDITTAQLIAIGVADRDGKIETLEAQVAQLNNIVAALIDRSGMSNDEILKITGCAWRYRVADDQHSNW